MDGTMDVLIPDPNIAGVLANIVLLVIDEIPAIDEMMAQILYGVAMKRYGDVRPSHTRASSAVKLVLESLRHIAEIHDTSIIVILAREYCQIEVRGMRVRDGVLVCVPSTKAKVQASHECKAPVNQK